MKLPKKTRKVHGVHLREILKTSLQLCTMTSATRLPVTTPYLCAHRKPSRQKSSSNAGEGRTLVILKTASLLDSVHEFRAALQTPFPSGEYLVKLLREI